MEAGAVQVRVELLQDQSMELMEVMVMPAGATSVTVMMPVGSLSPVLVTAMVKMALSWPW